MSRFLLLICMLWLFAGCSSAPYVYGTQGMDEKDGDSRPIDNNIVVGRPNKFLDAADWYWPGSLLSKLILWNRKIDSHEVSDETIDALRVYLERNELDDVQVLVNAYSPGTHWSRLFKNKEVGAGWRYTMGIYSAIAYTVWPGRFFGGDHYNPYTNTISIFSDIPAVALHEGGHAKDSNKRKYKGSYAALYAIPGVPLYHEAVASSDALSYLRVNCMLEEEKTADRILHPAYGTYVGGTFYTGLGFIGAIPGHITGAIASSSVDIDEPCTRDTRNAELVDSEGAAVAIDVSE